MKKANKHKRDDEAQSKRFIEAAKEAEAAETERAADKAFRKVLSGPTKSGK